MTTSTQSITIKGTKDGLHFRLNSRYSFDAIIKELDQKLTSSHGSFLQGPLTHVHLHLGTLYVNKIQKEKLVRMIESAGNLLVKNIYADVISVEEANEHIRKRLPRIEVGTIRSGQVLESDQDILVLGDVNPGGWVISHGNIYVMGALKGYAHAGFAGDDSNIIAASLMEPTQLRIADMIATTFDENVVEDKLMKFAYTMNEKIVLAKLQSLAKIRPELAGTIFHGL